MYGNCYSISFPLYRVFCGSVSWLGYLTFYKSQQVCLNCCFFSSEIDVFPVIFSNCFCFCIHISVSSCVAIQFPQTGYFFIFCHSKKFFSESCVMLMPPVTSCELFFVFNIFFFSYVQFSVPQAAIKKRLLAQCLFMTYQCCLFLLLQ